MGEFRFSLFFGFFVSFASFASFVVKRVWLSADR
jgi:hypothetical protein